MCNRNFCLLHTINDVFHRIHVRPHTYICYGRIWCALERIFKGLGLLGDPARPGYW